MSYLRSISLFLLTGILFTTLSELRCQSNPVTEDIAWLSTRLTLQSENGWSYSLRPITRLRDDLTRFHDLSWDISAQYRIDDHWAVSVLERYWIVFDGKPDRNFLFFDVSYRHSLSDLRLKVNHRVRLHWAQDINKNTDGDFFRYQISALLDWPKVNEESRFKLRPILAVEPFLDFNDDFYAQRIRWQVGLRADLGSELRLDTFYWYEAFGRKASVDHWNIIVLTLSKRLFLPGKS